MRTLSLLLFSLLVVCTLLRGEEKPPPAQPPDPGRPRMLEELEKIAEESSERNPFLGSGRLRQMRDFLARPNLQLPPDEEWRLRFLAGVEALRMGHEREAIDLLLRARELSPNPKLAELARLRTLFMLGVAYMRLGETENCCLRNTPESCIVPLRGAALHTKKEGSTQAIRYFLELLGRKPKDPQERLKAAWLLNVAHMTLGTYPEKVPPQHLVPAAAFQSEVDFPRFPNRAAELGLDTFSLSGGAIVDDFDGDDYLDIVTSTWDTAGQLRYFRNNQDGTFSDRTEAAGLLSLLGGLNIRQTDYNGDGRLDIFVLRGAWLKEAGQHPNSLLRNDGNGTFTDVTFAAGLGEVHYPTQTAEWADYDLDGDLDLYIGNEFHEQLKAPCQLFRNNNDGTFTDVARNAGVENRAYTKGASWGDFDGDRFPDLYVSNYDGPNRLYRNKGDGTFTDVAAQLGVTRPERSFPTWFWDFNNDGALDLFAASYRGEIQHLAAYHRGEPVTVEVGCLYQGDGRGGFREVSREQKLARPFLPMGSNYGDLDGDGYLDFYLGTGDPSIQSLMPNLMFLNREGQGFTNVLSGGFGHLQKGHSVAFADIDNDGDLDVFEQMGGAFPGDKYGDALYENPGFGNHWLTVKLVGQRSNRAAIGARLRIDVISDGRQRSIYRRVTGGGSFGANPLRQTMGIGKATTIRLLEVTWPASGLTQQFRDVPPDQAIRIVEGDEDWTAIPLKRFRLGG